MYERRRSCEAAGGKAHWRGRTRTGEDKDKMTDGFMATAALETSYKTGGRERREAAAPKGQALGSDGGGSEGIRGSWAQQGNWSLG